MEDRIRNLSAQAVAAVDPAEANRILEELTAALRLHAERLRSLASRGVAHTERRQDTVGRFA